nr:MAG TPA: hypothetical protein [Caudoviricetes sp.]
MSMYHLKDKGIYYEWLSDIDVEYALIHNLHIVFYPYEQWNRRMDVYLLKRGVINWQILCLDRDKKTAVVYR